LKDYKVAKANGGLAKVAKLAGLERESLYQALSAQGNPRLSTLPGIMKAVGLRLTVEMAYLAHLSLSGNPNLAAGSRRQIRVRY
jgi:DNA-binding phage protein